MGHSHTKREDEKKTKGGEGGYRPRSEAWDSPSPHGLRRKHAADTVISDFQAPEL